MGIIIHTGFKKLKDLRPGSFFKEVGGREYIYCKIDATCYNIDCDSVKFGLCDAILCRPRLEIKVVPIRVTDANFVVKQTGNPKPLAQVDDYSFFVLHGPVESFAIYKPVQTTIKDGHLRRMICLRIFSEGITKMEMRVVDFREDNFLPVITPVEIIHADIKAYDDLSI